MKVHKENTDKFDRAFRDSPFAKKYKASNEEREFMRNANKSKVLKAKKK